VTRGHIGLNYTYPVTRPSWYSTLTVRLSGLGKARLVVSFEHEQLAGHSGVPVANRCVFASARFRYRFQMAAAAAWNKLSCDGSTSLLIAALGCHAPLHAARKGRELDRRDVRFPREAA
jgi:hypothetical protein